MVALRHEAVIVQYLYFTVQVAFSNYISVFILFPNVSAIQSFGVCFKLLGQSFLIYDSSLLESLS